MASFTLKTDVLDKLLRALKSKPPIAQVGILGDTTQREGSGPNNATIGATHEFGSSKVPQRSFLRIPLMNNLKKQLESSGAFDKHALDEVIKQKSLLPWTEKLAIIGESIVIVAFDEQGPGWAPLAASTLAHKKVKQILTESGQLRNSITSRVVEG